MAACSRKVGEWGCDYPLPMGEELMAPPVRHVAVTGGTSIVGQAFTSHLEGAGVRVTRLARVQELRALKHVDAMVHLAGAGMSEGRWTDVFKAQLRASRVEEAQRLADIVAGLTNGVHTVILGSSTAYYGNRGDDICTESAPQGKGFLASLAADAEKALLSTLPTVGSVPSTSASASTGACSSPVRAVAARIGTVLSTDGGYLRQLMIPFRYRVGVRIGSGRQYVPWVTPMDTALAIAFILRSPSIAGPVNISSPYPATNGELVTLISRVLRRGAVIPIPLAALRLAFGADLVEESLLWGARALPRVLSQAGFRFAAPDLEPALRSILLA